MSAKHTRQILPQKIKETEKKINRKPLSLDQQNQPEKANRWFFYKMDQPKLVRNFFPNNIVVAATSFPFVPSEATK